MKNFVEIRKLFIFMKQAKMSRGKQFEKIRVHRGMRLLFLSFIFTRQFIWLNLTVTQIRCIFVAIYTFSTYFYIA